VRGQLCERARNWASLRVDDELSELESALLDAHLARCAECTAFALEVQDIAAALRTAPVEWPEPVVLDVARQIRRRRTPARLVQTAAAATLVVAAALAGSVLGIARPGSGSAGRPVAMVAANESGDQLRRLRRPGLVEAARPVPRNRSTSSESA
jgi:predicted anti-sigma-YlaC factor YlaD